MYLEERVGQLEILSVDHGRQIETIAKGLADLTVTVNNRFDRVEKDIAGLKRDMSDLQTGVSDLKSGQTRLETTVADIQQTQQLILTILKDKLK